MVLFFRPKNLRINHGTAFYADFHRLCPCTPINSVKLMSRPSTVCYLPFGELRHIMTCLKIV